MPDFKKEFPVLANYTYLNTAYSGLMREDLVKWRRKCDEDYLLTGSQFRNDHHTFTETIRNEVAGFFNCDPQGVSLVPNFSFAFNTLISGLGTNKKVLLLQSDYPSVNEPFQGGGFNLVYAEIDENLEQNITKAVARHKPDVLALSIVQYINGIKVDLSFLKQLKDQYPELLILADGTQYCGTESFDFADSGIDVLGASGYKWMLSGYGNGFMLFKKNSIPQLFKNSFPDEQKNGFSEYQIHLMHHFEPGHLDILNFGSLLYSIRYLNSLGKDKITSQIKNISIRAKDILSEKGLLETSVQNRSDHSSIFNINAGPDCLESLKSKKIICSQRGKGIRISFHFYNTENDLDTLLLHLNKR